MDCRSIRRVVVVCVIVAAAAAAPSYASEDAAGLARSDVVLIGPGAVETCEAYGCTLVRAGGPGGTAAELRGRKNALGDRWIRYVPAISFRPVLTDEAARDGGLADCVCLDLDGDPIPAAGAGGADEGAEPVYRYCTNAPAYREFLKRQSEPALRAGVDALHVEGYSGTAGAHLSGGCFCEHCMAGFRDHLAEALPEDALKSLGIASIDDFDYGEFLRNRGVSSLRFATYSGSTPERIALSHEFLAFQRSAAAGWLAEYSQWAEETAGHPVGLSADSPISGPEEASVAPTVGLFCGEIAHLAEPEGGPPQTVWAFKLGDAFRRPVVCTATQRDWAYVQEAAGPGLVGGWIAQAYAFGHHFAAPVDAPACSADDVGLLYRFVRDNAPLFDGYEAVAKVGLIYDNAAFVQGERDAMDACECLARMNVPFRILVAGDGEVEQRLDGGELARLSLIVAAKPLYLDDDQKGVLEPFRSRVIAWPCGDRLSGLLPPLIRLDGAADVTAVPRARAGDPSAPYVCHLVNRSHDAALDSPAPLTDFRVRFAQSLFDAPVTRAVLYAPGRDPKELELVRVPGGCAVVVPELDLWAVLKLEHD
jgi:hypothetical protein